VCGCIKRECRGKRVGERREVEGREWLAGGLGSGGRVLGFWGIKFNPQNCACR